MTDQKSNLNKIYTTIGASNHALDKRQEDDYYATAPRAIDDLLKFETFNHHIWECAVGGGHLADRLEQYEYEVYGTDIVDRGWYATNYYDFLNNDNNEIKFSKWHGDIITNPPYKNALEFIKKSLDVVDEGNKVAMFLKLTFLEGQSRKEFFLENPPKTVYVFSKRIPCAKNGDFDKYPSSAVAYAWFVWVKGYKGDTVVKWI